MREFFGCAIPNNTPHEIEKAKKMIGECASEMGFGHLSGEWNVRQYGDPETGKLEWRVEAVFTS